MATKVVMAQLSPTMEEGKLIEWKISEGDAVSQGDIVAEIETDKANMDVEAMGAGVLRKIVVQHPYLAPKRPPKIGLQSPWAPGLPRRPSRTPPF